MSAANNPPADAAIRERIAGELDRTFLVEAAAGTGKTTSLVSRMVALIREGRCRIDQIAAITFTIKAAAELRERFQVALEESAGTTMQPEQRERIDTALLDLSSAFIGTIHAFCARLLRERPVEAGLDPAFDEVTEDEAAALPLEFWDRYVQRLFASGDTTLVELHETGVRPGALYSFFGRLCEYPDVEAVVSQVKTPPDLAPVLSATLAFLQDAEVMLLEDKGPAEDKLKTTIRQMIRRRKVLRPGSAMSIVSLLDLVDSSSGRKAIYKNWTLPKEQVKGLEAAANSLFSDTVGPALLRWREYTHALIMRIMIPAVELFAEERRAAGKLTFHDLLLNARTLVRDHASVRRYFQRRFTHILVDEFQDTDPVQAELIFYLTAEDVSERNWQNVTPRPGALFIVGDPKQSIYRFRRADIATYLQVQAQIERSGGESLQLTTNFRSVPELCSHVNEFFSTVFTGLAVEERRQARHVSVVPHRATSGSIGVYVVETQPGKAEDVAAREAEWVARWIRDAVDSGLPLAGESGDRPASWSDFMLLSWTRGRLQEYAEQLTRGGVPFEVTGARAFAESEELQRLTPVLRALSDGDDSVAIVTYLRGPLAGVDDQALYDFRVAGGSFRVGARVPDGCDARIAAALELLREGSRWVRTQPPAAAIAHVVERLGLAGLAAALPRAEVRSGNLQKTLTLARQLSAGGASFSDVVNELGRIASAARCDIEEMSINPGRDNVVRLMNVHQAKGLEAGVVFLIDPNEPPDFPLESHIDRDGGEPRGYFVVPGPKRPNSFSRSRPLALPPGWDERDPIERDFKNREDERLLYVAATRARNMLVIGRQSSAGDKAGAWHRLVRGAAPLFTVAAPSREEQREIRFVDDFRAAEKRLAERRLAAHLESYAVTLVTKMAHADGATMVKHEEGYGRGTSWGRVLHRLFEALMRNPSLDVRRHAANLLTDEEREVAEIEDVLRIVEGVRVSPLWRRALAADEHLVEVPFAMMVPAGEGETLLHGAIDLVFREGSTWYVVDYKSDRTAGRLESLVAHYASQVQHYARFWTQLTGKPTEAGLFFVDSLDEVWVPV